MGKFLRLSILSGTVALLTLLANVNAASASIIWHYQPTVPEELRR
ncbi:MAG TPA: cyclic lactone autoinducer peptide [Clostridia bacterium]|jgi:cyclic lactone autoinducer peptide|nr:cyclic lactone autoinducer peptide [Clostridia bacterium]